MGTWAAQVAGVVSLGSVSIALHWGFNQVLQTLIFILFLFGIDQASLRKLATAYEWASI